MVFVIYRYSTVPPIIVQFLPLDRFRIIISALCFTRLSLSRGNAVLIVETQSQNCKTNFHYRFQFHFMLVPWIFFFQYYMYSRRRKFKAFVSCLNRCRFFFISSIDGCVVFIKILNISFTRYRRFLFSTWFSLFINVID